MPDMDHIEKHSENTLISINIRSGLDQDTELYISIQFIHNASALYKETNKNLPISNNQIDCTTHSNKSTPQRYKTDTYLNQQCKTNTVQQLMNIHG